MILTVVYFQIQTQSIPVTESTTHTHTQENGQYKTPQTLVGGDSNLYGYILGNPVNFIDSMGQKGLETTENAKSAVDTLGFMESLRKFFGTQECNNSIDLATQILQFRYGINGARIKYNKKPKGVCHAQCFKELN